MGMNDKERRRRKRSDLPRARIAGTIHQVRRRPVPTESTRAWLVREGLNWTNTTVCGLSFRHTTLPDTYVVTCMECIAMDDLDVLKAELEQAKEDHGGACKLVALMHAAAVGEVTGPNRGVVEDVADLRTERDALKKENAELRAQLETLRQERP